MKHFLLIFFIILSSSDSYTQNKIKVLNYNANNIQQYIDSIFFKNKILDSNYKHQINIALSHYPSLIKTKIVFKEKKIKTSMAAMPKLSNIFKKRKNRTYYIFINSKSKYGDDLLLKNLPINAQIGVIGHEIAHIYDFHNKNNFTLILNSVGYLFTGFKKKIEAKTDSITIIHGLGHQLYEFDSLIFNNKNISEKYLKMKNKIYLKPSEIKSIMLRNGY